MNWPFILFFPDDGIDEFGNDLSQMVPVVHGQPPMMTNDQPAIVNVDQQPGDPGTNLSPSIAGIPSYIHRRLH